MNLSQCIHDYLPWATSQSPAEIDTEIREELLFHLEMRTEENVRAGMSLEEARRDAQQRFGDFEAHRSACRSITLWPRLVVARLQTALVVVLIGVVAYQGLLLWKLQSSHHAQIESLRQLVVEVQAESQSDSEASAVMPYIRFDQEPADSLASIEPTPSANVLTDWKIENPVQHPWSDWRSLDPSPN